MQHAAVHAACCAWSPGHVCLKDDASYVDSVTSRRGSRMLALRSSSVDVLVDSSDKMLWLAKRMDVELKWRRFS